ncbi:MAG: DUF2207 domain-containing protein [Actinobacteria bacterium]|nr:DUF2207 domain-containing protein [Actinomycetota bacterium]
MASEKRNRGGPRAAAAMALVTVAAVVFSLLAAGSSPAQASYSYQAYHSDITVNPDGTLLLRDRVTYGFTSPGEWVGLYIPVSYGEMGDARVLDASGVELAQDAWAREDGDEGTTLWCRDLAGAAEATFIYEYSLSGSLSRKGETVGMEWAVVPGNRSSPIAESSLTIHFPPGTDLEAVEFEVYTKGDAGSVTKRFPDGSTAVVEVNDLGADSSYSFSCYWPASVMEEGFDALAPQVETPPSLQQKSWEYSRFDVDLQVNPDSSLSVRETLVADFHGSFSFLTRYLPEEEKRFDEGKTCGRVRVHDIAVHDLEGNPYDPDLWSVGRDSGGVNVRIEFKATDESRGWILSYRMTGVTVFAPGYDRLYWNAVPPDRNVSIRTSRITARLPKAVEMSEVRTEVYLDPYEPPASHEHGVEGTTLWWEAKDIPAYTTVTIDVSYPKGLVRKPWQFTAPCAFLVFGGGAALFLASLAFMLLRWWRQGRDVERSQGNVVRYDPPAGLRPAMLAMLMREKPRVEDISYTIIDLACRGKLSIVEKEGGGFLNKVKFGFKRRTRDGSDLLPYEKLILDGLFEKGDEVDEDDLRYSFYTNLPAILEGISDEVMARGLFLGEPRSVRSAYNWAGALLALPPTVAVILLYFIFDLGWFIYLPAGFIAAGVCVAAIGVFMPRRSAEGSRAYQDALGYKEFLSTAERQELAYMTPENFQANLPYAMALGVEESWAGKFKQIYMEPPDWYRGGSASFNAVYLASSLSHMAGNLDHTLASSPSSSGGSGSYGGGGFGGGFSGGGFGGGGTSAG